MRKVFIIVITLLLVLSACNNYKSSSQNGKFEPENFQLSDLSVYDTISKKQIYINMDKSDVEYVLGKGQAAGQHLNYDGLEIFYRNDKVAYMKISDSRYSTSRNISIGTAKRDVLRNYGSYWESVHIGTYPLLVESKSIKYLKGISSNDYKKYDTDKLYFITFVSSKEELISGIIIGDYQYCIYMK